jgi:hypothetical protein
VARLCKERLQLYKMVGSQFITRPGCQGGRFQVLFLDSEVEEYRHIRIAASSILVSFKTSQFQYLTDALPSLSHVYLGRGLKREHCVLHN